MGESGTTIELVKENQRLKNKFTELKDENKKLYNVIEALIQKIRPILEDLDELNISTKNIQKLSKFIEDIEGDL